MLWEQRVRYAALTDIGFRRQNNQDSCAVTLCPSAEIWEDSGHLFVVADGMGGHAVGELASKIATDTVPHMFAKLRGHSQIDALRIAIETANENINERGSLNQDFLRMGTTCSALVLCSQGAVIGHVGDSRVYRIRNRQIDQLTFDHSLVWEMIRSKRMHPKDAEKHCPRNVITRSLGPEPQVNVDMEGPFPIMPGDVFVLCSDGLCGLVSDAEIGMIAGTLSPEAACRMLVNLANLRGGPDNITVIVTNAGDLPEGVDMIYEVPAPPPRIEGLSWGGFGMMCLLAVFFLIGLYFFELDVQRRLHGAAILLMTSLSSVGFWAWHRSRTRGNYQEHDPDATTNWRPYRSAPAIITDEFIEDLTSIETDLHHAALEEGIAVDWNQYEETFSKARSAIEARLFGRVLVEYGRLFDLLMSAIQQQRKQHQKESRAKKGSSPAIPTTNSAPVSPAAENFAKAKTNPDMRRPSNGSH